MLKSEIYTMCINLESAPMQCFRMFPTEQVPGCGRDLLREKEYYRRYRVCRNHATAREVRCT